VHLICRNAAHREPTEVGHGHLPVSMSVHREQGLDRRRWGRGHGQHLRARERLRLSTGTPRQPEHRKGHERPNCATCAGIRSVAAGVADFWAGTHDGTVTRSHIWQRSTTSWCSSIPTGGGGSGRFFATAVQWRLDCGVVIIQPRIPPRRPERGPFGSSWPPLSASGGPNEATWHALCFYRSIGGPV